MSIFLWLYFIYFKFRTIKDITVSSKHIAKNNLFGVAIIDFRFHFLF